MQVDGLILAGGKSSRMGSNIASKAFVKLDNKPLIEHAITSIKSQVNNLYVSGSKTNLLGIEYPIIEALAAKYSGPLAGLYSALASTFSMILITLYLLHVMVPLCQRIWLKNCLIA